MVCAIFHYFRSSGTSKFIGHRTEIGRILPVLKSTKPSSVICTKETKAQQSENESEIILAHFFALFSSRERAWFPCREKNSRVFPNWIFITATCPIASLVQRVKNQNKMAHPLQAYGLRFGRLQIHIIYTNY